MEKRVVVIGAGTAGLISAARLARLDKKVNVYERKKGTAQINNASGILSVSGLQGLDINYKEGILNKLDGALIHFPSVSLRVESKKTQAYVIDRSKLNELCREDAVGSGAIINYEEGVTERSLAELRRSSIVVGADGAVSSVARHFRFPGIGRYLLTYRAEYRIKSENDRLVELFFNNMLTPGMFGWIAPHGDNTEVGVGIDSKRGNSMNAFKQFIHMPKLREKFSEIRVVTKGASIIPIELRKKFVDEKNGVLLIGDAAGQVKASTGGGIIFGGNAALLAADAIANHFDKAASLVTYEKEWRRRFGLDIRLHKLINNLYSSMNNRELDLLGKSMKALKFEDFMSRYGDMDRPSIMLKRFFLRGFAK